MPATELHIRLTPRASRAQIGPVRADGALAVRVTAPPVDGKANVALCKLLASELGLAPSRVSVVRGHTARDKVVRIEGVQRGAVAARLNMPVTD
jgi:hypothetical protein